MIREMPEETLREGLRVNRDTLFGEIFRRFPERLSESGKRQDAAIQWCIGGRPEGGYDRWFVVLGNGECKVARDLDVKPRVTFTIGDLDFIRLVTGNADPGRLILRRKLRIRGDLLFAARLQRFFPIPGAARSRS